MQNIFAFGLNWFIRKMLRLLNNVPSLVPYLALIEANLKILVKGSYLSSLVKECQMVLEKKSFRTSLGKTNDDPQSL